MSAYQIHIERLPTHLARVHSRLSTVGIDDTADSFLCVSYLSESVVKTIAACLWSGIRERAPDIAYGVAYRLLRADGLGDWEAELQQMSTHPIAGYLSPAFQPSIRWLTEKRKQSESQWFYDALEKADRIAAVLGYEGEGSSKRPRTVRHLIRQLVYIRNKTKAHGAVGADFYSDCNGPYYESVAGLIATCPLFSASWMHLSRRKNKGTVHGVSLKSVSPVRMLDADCMRFETPEPGIYFLLEGMKVPVCTGDLIRTSPSFERFLVPNGGMTGTFLAEFIDYATGYTEKVDASKFSLPPAPLPKSETHGLDELDVQSSVFGNLPPRPRGYVEREELQGALVEKLLDGNHHIITLHGRGGIGKTSLALWAAHELADQNESVFESIVWFSARDVDLRSTGPSPVRAAVSDLKSVAKSYGRMFQVAQTEEKFAEVLQASDADGVGTLFIFDNFETFAESRQLHEFLDTHTHLPNKVLMTSRERAFKADYPIEVRGMEEAEAVCLLQIAARDLGIENLIGDKEADSIYRFTDGHPYVMRVMVGEIAKSGRFVPVKSVLPKRADIVDAVFERSFNKLTSDGKWVFLIVANSKHAVPELALTVVCAEAEIDAEAGADECVRLSLITSELVSDGSFYYWSPELARLFSRKKLESDEDRLPIQKAVEDVRKFGIYQASEIQRESQVATVEAFISNLRRTVHAGDQESILKHDALLEKVAELYPPAWLELSRYRRHFKLDRAGIDYALRRAVEEQPFNKKVWLERAEFAEEIGEEGLYIASLVSAVDSDPTDVALIREVALKLCQFIDKNKHAIPRTRRGVYIAGVRRHMEALADQLDATALSRLAWLFLQEENQEKALKYARMGMERDPMHEHCLRILERLDGGVA